RVRHLILEGVRPAVPVLVNSLGMALALVPAGTFEMGSDEVEQPDEPLRRVTLTRPFYPGVHPVTQGQYLLVMKTNPSRYRGDRSNPAEARLPAESMTWGDAVEFCQRLADLPAEKAAG